MIVQCPQCQTKYRLTEQQLAGRTQVQVRCTKCNITFPAQAVGLEPGESQPEATMLSQSSAILRLPADKRLSLSATSGPLKGQIFPISKPQLVLGRTGADIVVEDPEVSRKHCALEVHGNRILLIDLSSTNGTYVSGERIETCELEHMMEFRMGATTFVFTVYDK